MSWYKKADLTAGFGLGITCYSMLWYTLIVINCECMAIKATQAFGGMSYLPMRLSFVHGLLMNLLITLGCTWLYKDLDRILISINFDATLSKISRDMVWWTVPA